MGPSSLWPRCEGDSGTWLGMRLGCRRGSRRTTPGTRGSAGPSIKELILQKVRQRAGHGSLEVTSRYAAILDERDTSLADAREEIFEGASPAT
jgi:hypothetical protein